MFVEQAQIQQIVGSLGGNTTVVNVSSGHDNNVLMHQLQQFNELNQLSSDFVKSNPLPGSSFEPDQYLRNDGFEQLKPGSALTTRFDVGRYRYRRPDSSDLTHFSYSDRCGEFTQ